MKTIELIKARKVIAGRADEKVSASLAYKMMKFMKASETEDAFFNAKLKEIVERYGEKDGAGKLIYVDNGVSIAKNAVDECKGAIAELENTETDAPDIRFPLAELEQLKLSMSEIFALENFITEGGG